ncbi:Flp pilus assembly protein CpaB [Serpentinicella sp. ANB-PHB4]|uniref:Flp pilus assembly protein CpaB n=1 Tax=Serpentinicella sp. ANB-PHB4 TaxID=3074076 RepID=UPI002854D0DD|nr:Flp pilus assembly protein CpaB [Serpentinicella sp. ANB-PHB4]MDR5658930.1 Flp pilus assembly protein CpaB [Serpentinicella sp. ANB-PHB4]
MKNKVVFLLAIVFGLATALMTFSYLNNLKQSVDNTEYIEIIVAKENIQERTVVTMNMIERKTIPVQYMDSNQITSSKEVVGKITLTTLSKGQSIFQSHIIEKGDYKEGLAYMIPQGKRAMSVPVDEVSGVSGLIKPGNKVDVITTIAIGEEVQVPHSVVVLQNIEVLAIGRDLNIKVGENAQNPTEARTATLAVTLEESLPLQMATQRGTISLMLRSPIDNTTSDPEPFEINDFLR